jgi:hypothetical protein
MQLLVFDVASGQAVVNSNIPGLKEALGVAAESPFISVSRVLSWTALYESLVYCGFVIRFP